MSLETVLTRKSREEIDHDFEELEKLLAVYPLRTENGGTRIAKAGEFMLMHTGTDGTRGFKHIMTRNYLFMEPIPERRRQDSEGMFKTEKSFRLIVPCDEGAFMQGFFDNPDSE